MGLIFSESFQDNFKEREFSRKEKLISESYGNCTLMSHYLYTKSYVFKTIKYSKGNNAKKLFSALKTWLKILKKIISSIKIKK